MKKIMVSSIFFLITAILFSTKYISVSILLAKSNNLDSDLFRATFKSLPLELTMIYSMAFFLGIVFFLLGIKEYKRG